MSKRLTIIYFMIVIVLAVTFFLISTEISKAANTNINGPNYKNVSVWTYVNITNSKPEILQVSVYLETNYSIRNITLNAGLARTVTCNATVRDWNGYADVKLVNGTFWDTAVSEINGTDNNNSHYTNTNCTNTGNGVNYTINYVCEFYVMYYANNGTWNCNITATDTFNKTGTKGNSTLVNALYALNVTDGINYGNVAVEDTSLEKTANVTNFGNMPINITVEGYGYKQGDGLAMNCSISGNITVDNERFAISSGAFGTKNQLTNNAQNVNSLTISKQTVATNPIVNATYWQLLIPPNPAGNCTGYVIFTAMAS
jgi:hypothetical protein